MQLFNFRKSGLSFFTIILKKTSGNGLYLIVFSLILFLLCVSPENMYSQSRNKKAKADTVKVHSAKKATLYSAILPGLGQAYNKKYWKIPVLYAGFGVLYYFIKTNGGEYRKFRTAYNIVATGDSAHFDNEYVVKYDHNLDQLEDGRNYYRRNYELSWILTGFLYILNLIDASVDANLYTYDVSDNLSLRFEPVIEPTPTISLPNPGIKLTFRF